MGNGKAYGTDCPSLEILMSQGGRARKVRTPAGKAVDSMLAVYQDRITFTFVMEAEVASIHFDAGRHQIFFKGHNIENLPLDGNHLKALWRLKDVLKEDEEGRQFLEEYHATLVRRLADPNR